MSAPLIEAKGLSKTFTSRGVFRRGRAVQAVRQVDVALAGGEAVGVVGESGSGKSTLGRLMLGLLPATEGTVRFDGRTLDRIPRAEWRTLRRRMQIVFQDPYGSLDPRRRVGSQIADGLAIHGLVPAGERDRRVGELPTMVGLDPLQAKRFPHEFSGGQRQRVGIARALAVEPQLVICDESVSALDVSVQAQVLNLLKDLQEQRGLTYIFISHDLGVVKFMSDVMAVMQGGRIVEMGPADEIYANPQEAYTRNLIDAIPRDDLAHIEERQRARAAAATLRSKG